MSDNNSIVKQLRENNPFESSASPMPWENMNPDLQQLNRSASEEIEQLIRHKRREPSMPLVGLILGEAGSGKTHMLTRILRRLKTNSRPAIFVTVRAFRDPESVTQDLLSEIFISLMQFHSSNMSQFDLLVNEIINSYHEHRQNDGFTDLAKVDTKIYLSRDIPGLDKNVLKCILLYADTKDENKRALILEWLREGLDDEDAVNLGLPPRDIDSMTDAKKESNAEKILISLGLLLAYAHVPMIVCFDQLDYMSVNKELIEAWGNIIHLLTDNLVGILPLCFMKSQIWNDKIKPSLNSSVYQRLEHHKIVMGECSLTQAKQLIRDRIDFAFNENQEQIYQWLIERVKLNQGCSPRMVIELANRAIFKDDSPAPAANQGQTPAINNNGSDSEIYKTIKGVYDDECKKIRGDYRAWPPNADLLALSLGVWLSSLDGFEVAQDNSKHLKITAIYNDKKFAFFIVTSKFHQSTCNALKQGIAMSNDCQCFYISETKIHKKTWKQANEIMQEFIDSGGKVLLLDKDSRVQWYGLAALINRVDNGDVNIYSESKPRAATRNDIKNFVKSLKLITVSPVKARVPAVSPSLENSLIEIINASPMKIISTAKAAEMLDSKNQKISAGELLDFVRANNKFRLFPSKDDTLISMADRK
ncbi:MAG: ATP-binding protein [Synergistaceae bacterium]|nr:ATP-binding protein [Synergistaceae bacterium]